MTGYPTSPVVGRTVVTVVAFPSMRWPKLLRVLQREPLSYTVTRQSGSHRTLESTSGKPTLHLAFHDNAEIPSGMVRKILVRDVGLSEVEALQLL
jgi:predicted RNA binding protein YcfA (HicA-like mRNA interferase family)